MNVTLMISGGLYCHDLAALILSCTFLLGRILYTVGYSVGMPSSRKPGALISSLSTLALIVLNGYGVVKGFIDASKE